MFLFTNSVPSNSAPSITYNSVVLHIKITLLWDVTPCDFICQTIWCCIPEDHNLNVVCHENLKSHVNFILFWKIMSFTIYTLHQILLRWSNHGEWDGVRNVLCLGVMGNAYTVLVENLWRRNHLEDKIEMIHEVKSVDCINLTQVRV
jgi:hypothetical protein